MSTAPALSSVPEAYDPLELIDQLPHGNARIALTTLKRVAEGSEPPKQPVSALASMARMDLENILRKSDTADNIRTLLRALPALAARAEYQEVKRKLDKLETQMGQIESDPQDLRILFQACKASLSLLDGHLQNAGVTDLDTHSLNERLIGLSTRKLASWFLSRKGAKKSEPKAVSPARAKKPRPPLTPENWFDQPPHDFPEH